MPRVKKLLLIVFMFLIVVPTHVSAYQLVILGPNNEVIKYKEGKTVEGDTAFSVLKKSGVSYVDEGDKYPQYEGCYITSIAGIPMSKSQGWVFTVNGNWVMHSASVTKIHGDDKVMWCAYANADNQTKYQWPVLSEKTEEKKKDLIVETKSSKSDKESNKESKKTEIKTSDSSKSDSKKSDKEEPKTEQKLEEKKQEENKQDENKQEYDVNSVVENMLNEGKQNKDGEIQPSSSMDFRIYGYIGFIISFIIAIQLYKMMKGDNHEDK